MNNNAAIEISDLLVLRSTARAVDHVSFVAPRGQVTGLLGPSGCGKTTLMRSIVGVQIVTSGSVIVLGLPAGHPKLRARIGYVTQAPSVYDDLTVAENLRFFARVLGVSSDEVDRCVESVDLGTHQTRVVNSLSGGQSSRVSLAVALLGEPELLVLDEPTVGLDPVLRRDLWALFHRLADRGTAVLVSSHVMDEAERCDRLLLMRDGALLADDSPGQLLTSTGASDVESAFLAIVEPGGAA
ncbi:MAG TPA: ABC transporter ATP-binding protein [Nocardioidaceae bacterium]|nr:ABC transporter ATP-binding protein [Nocardioidaceae bacterium]